MLVSVVRFNFYKLPVPEMALPVWEKALPVWEMALPGYSVAVNVQREFIDPLLFKKNH